VRLERSIAVRGESGEVVYYDSAHVLASFCRLTDVYETSHIRNS
jgi:hypothetical protein